MQVYVNFKNLKKTKKNRIQSKDQIRSDQIRSDQVRSDQIRSDQIRPMQIKSNHILQGLVKVPK